MIQENLNLGFMLLALVISVLTITIILTPVAEQIAQHDKKIYKNIGGSWVSIKPTTHDYDVQGCLCLVDKNGI